VRYNIHTQVIFKGGHGNRLTEVRIDTTILN
jgi:hypothetical protein